MKPKVIAYMRNDSEIDKLKNIFDVTSFLDQEYIGHPMFDRALNEAEGIIGLALQVTKELIDSATNLKVVSNVSVGYDNLDMEELTRRGILATNTPGVLNDTTADAIFALLLATARRVTELDQFVKSGQWTLPLQPSQYGIDVHHKTLGIIGMGNIGQSIAKRAHFGFDMNILYHNRTPNKDTEEKYDATYCELNDLLEQSDFVCLMVPASKNTEKMIGKEEFNRMKSSAIFINGSRGANVDEEALYYALKNGVIHAAGIDVFTNEPTETDNPLLKLNNIVTLPHVGSSTTECELSMSRLACDNLTKALTNQKPPNLLNEDVYQNDKY